ncbi:CBS domain-containing protein [Halorientalis sp.]|jgi:predicted transcriptional regulator|uniref:CBS domain-containing protein n=1 Tax=Halorientalis sp. TaxID=1931229 RepID=UPI002628D1CA|nr:CBS domain-containing protein [Halorientalis sp.]
MLVKHIMTEQFEVVQRTKHLREAVELMLGNDVDHVLVIEENAPVSMLTRRKALTACYKTDAPLSEIPISGFSRGLETRVGPNESALICVGKLRRAKVDCLPVVDGMSVEGVITNDDILDNLSNITEEMLENEKRREEWTG